jgi:hypothetical protein
LKQYKNDLLFYTEDHKSIKKEKDFIRIEDYFLIPYDDELIEDRLWFSAESCFSL